MPTVDLVKARDFSVGLDLGWQSLGDTVLVGAGAIVLAPLAAWTAEAAPIAPAPALVQRSAAGLVGERILGPSPGP